MAGGAARGIACRLSKYGHELADEPDGFDGFVEQRSVPSQPSCHC